MERTNRWQRRCLAVIASAALVATGGLADATTPPSVSFTGYDLAITSLRDHGGCDEGTVGQLQRNSHEEIHQNLGDDGASSTLARITVWNWNSSARRIHLRGTGTNDDYRVIYFTGDKNITREVVAGTFTTPLLKRGWSFRISMRVSMRQFVPNGHSEPFDVRALGVRFTNSSIPGDRVRTNIVSVPYDVVIPCHPPM